MGNLSTPISVQKLQMALNAKAKAEAGYRFYALYDKTYREDVLAHAYAQCPSNKGAPGVDRQDFAAVEACGVQKWLGELALALRQETYRPDPIRRVFIPKANGKLRHWASRPCVIGCDVRWSLREFFESPIDDNDPLHRVVQLAHVASTATSDQLRPDESRVKLNYGVRRN
ncbi:hypothetical protein PTKU46_96940 [Paraburkholderia terrae]|uniref:hypothetical protein n=1 Tax=Paraburkholderia terrae TaxID=311230 RepID=UPI0030DE60E7